MRRMESSENGPGFYWPSDNVSDLDGIDELLPGLLAFC